ncbi:hypothetical protein QVD17_03171 [Tagetes erecta]|uniref:Uncharacterized protein n=1 Tax=Tagetes erecta TaxID=13708 RepID=A0AAD8LH15_TARER|nr:hypothetical protein QVD17_03171 [Tagetes erecta]
METIHKPTFLLLFVFTLLNLSPFSDSRATILGDHAPRSVDQAMITFADLTPVKPDEHQHPHGSSGSMSGSQGNEMGKDDQERAVLLNELQQDPYGASSGYGSPYSGGIYGLPRDFFLFPRGLFGFPRGLFGFPRGLFGFPRGIFGFPGVYGGNPGVYNPPPSRYTPGGGGYPKYEGKTTAEVNGKLVNSHD